jgi:hypothetical protein
MLLSSRLASALALTLALFASPASAQVRIEPFESMVTASGPPASVWLALRNDGDTAVRVRLASLVHRLEDGRREPLRWSGVEVDGARATEPVTVPAHGSVRVVAYVEGFAEDETHMQYDVRIVAEVEGGPRVRGRTRIVRGTRHPWR